MEHGDRILIAVAPVVSALIGSYQKPSDIYIIRFANSAIISLATIVFVALAMFHDVGPIKIFVSFSCGVLMALCIIAIFCCWFAIIVVADNVEKLEKQKRIIITVLIIAFIISLISIYFPTMT